MIDYTTLKHSSDGMPTWDAYLGIILNEASKKGVFTAAELKQAAVNQVNLPPSLKNLEYSSNSGENVAISRAGWALSDLKIAGLLHSPERNQYQIYQPQFGQIKVKKKDMKRENVASNQKNILA